MTVACPVLDGDAFLQSVLGFVDCQAQAIGSGSYQTLAAPGSTLSLLLTGMLTLFVAFFGYRMLFGQTPDVRDGVMALVKVGIVLALATSWPAYRTIFYNTVFHGPAELVEDVGRPAEVPGAGGGLVTQLGYVDNVLRALERLGPGPREAGRLQVQTRIVNGRNVTITEPEKEVAGPFDGVAIGVARIVFLTATIASMASVRIVAGILLALGPFFIAFLLFEGTRGLFEGWIRGLGAAVLGAVGVTILLGVELALVEPWLAWLLAQRTASQPIIGAPTQLLVVMSVFALVLCSMLAMAVRVALGFRLPAVWHMASARLTAGLYGGLPATQRAGLLREPVPMESRSRAAVVAEAVAATQRREARDAPVAGQIARATLTTPGRDPHPATPVPLGQTSRRRIQGRISASADRRDYRE